MDWNAGCSAGASEPNEKKRKRDCQAQDECRQRRKKLNEALGNIFRDLLTDPSLTTPAGRVRVQQALGNMVGCYITSKKHGLGALIDIYEKARPLSADEMSASVSEMNQTMMPGAPPASPPSQSSLPDISPLLAAPSPPRVQEDAAGANDDREDTLPDVDLIEGAVMDVLGSAAQNGVFNASQLAELPIIMDWDLGKLFGCKDTEVPGVVRCSPHNEQ